MSRRSKKKRSPKPLLPSHAAQRGVPRWAVMCFAIVVVLSFWFWWRNYESAEISPAGKPATLTTPSHPPAATSRSEFQKLTGRWQRPDGGYVLEIKSIAVNGALDAAYFNPKSIRVAKAEVSRDGGEVKVFIELRDVNYPGSIYSLTYDPAGDQLKGIYYQAAEKQRFEVAFVRMK
jgi:hypothetical protein